MFRFTKSLLNSLKLVNGLMETTNILPNSPIGVTTHLRVLNRVVFECFCTSSGSNSEGTNYEPDVSAITCGDPELEHKLKILILELDIFRQEGGLVPQNSTMTTQNWRELLKLSSLSGRKKYLLFLFKIEKSKENRLKKKEDKRLERELNPPVEKEDNVLNYDLGHNNMFLRFYESVMNTGYHQRLIQAMQFGEKLIIDCGYDEYMTHRENSLCAKQLMLLFGENRVAKEPFDLHFCNVDRETNLMKSLLRKIPTLYEPQFPLHIYKESYLDRFPKEKLVYLTPHCRDVLHNFDQDSIYIIGAIVDKVNCDPLSLAKAKKEGIRMAKLPLDHYLEWGSGSGKSLTLNHMLAILIDIKNTGDWNYALRHVPRRKLANYSRDTAFKRFNQAIGYTADVESRKMSSKRTWRPNTKHDLENLGYKNNIKSSINMKSILQDE